MNIKFWPSLHLLASVKIAREILHKFDLKAVKNNFFTTKGEISAEYSSEIISKINELKSGFNSPLFKTDQILGIVRSLALEVVKWFLSHEDILTDVKLEFSDIYWYSHGVIDRFETAKNLVEDENIHVKRRFILACKYFFEGHVHALWENMLADEKISLARQRGLVASMRYWISELNNGGITDCIRMFKVAQSDEYFKENYLGIRCYFNKLEPQVQCRCLTYGITNGEIHHFDLYLCFSQMNVNELRILLYSLRESTRLRVIELFLYWPLQHIFVEVVDQSWRFISHYNFRNILDFILNDKIFNCWHDVNYQQLLKDIWLRCPLTYKRRLKRDRIHTNIRHFVKVTY
ncbi:uncharacterized protein NPIL_132411 [Nephila pilipes]|uniref:Uncharacterized protein n=1 Tax=Nephila pilipes TaxID=299642 RepID=A0A8X6PBZ5_NEPPI|nr:uncharacterized protein NPIL_132411 [Nephila pilipes]